MEAGTLDSATWLEVLAVGGGGCLGAQDGEDHPGDGDHRSDDKQDGDDLADAVLAAVQLGDAGAGVGDERLEEDRHGTLPSPGLAMLRTGIRCSWRSTGGQNQKPAMARTRAGYKTKMMKPSSSTSSG